MKEIQRFLDEYGIRYKTNARSFILTCPECGGKDKLYIEKETGRSICFRQKTEGCPKVNTPLYSVLSVVSSLPPQKVREFFNRGQPSPFFQPLDELIPSLNENYSDYFIPKSNSTANSQPQQSPPIVPLLPNDIPNDTVTLEHPLALEGIKYLQEKRGLDISTLIKYHIGYIPSYKRIFFPVIMNQKIYGWQARTILNDIQPRMYNLPGPWKTHTLMFHDNLLTKNYAIVAEGAVSALKFEKVGGFVATMGKIVSKSQVKLMLKPHINTIYLALDPDAILDMIVLSDTIRQFNTNIQLKLIKTPKHREDFGDATYDECENAFLNASTIDKDNFLLYTYAMELL